MGGGEQHLPVDIEELHNLAVDNEEETYIDPHTGFMVFTAYAHWKRGPFLFFFFSSVFLFSLLFSFIHYPSQENAVGTHVVIAPMVMPMLEKEGRK